MADWYSVQVYQAHQGQGNEHLITVYMFLENAPDAFTRCRRMAGVSRHRGVHGLHRLSDDEVQDLEKLIGGERRLSEVKKTWYYPPESRNQGRAFYREKPSARAAAGRSTSRG